MKLSWIALMPLVFTSGLARATQDCAEILNLGFTKNVASVESSEISREEMKKFTGRDEALKFDAITTVEGKDFNEQDLFNDKSDLIIGIDTEGNTQGHTYLVIDGVRVDGRMFFQPETVTTSGWTLSKGLVIRYKNIPPESKAKLLEWLKSEEVLRVPTCVAAACAILFERGDFKGPGKRYWFPSKILDYLARTGLVNSQGVRSTAEVTTINEDVHVFWNNLPTIVRVPTFIFKVLFDPYTYAGSKKKKAINPNGTP